VNHLREFADNISVACLCCKDCYCLIACQMMISDVC